MSIFDTFKTIVLTVLIMAGIFIQYRPATAAEVEKLVVAGGCFWCVEADFEKVPGVLGAVSGFTGGKTENPTYKEVVNGNTGHFEAVEITFDPSRVTRADLLAKFLRSVDPTDAGGQFCDRGNSYRTAIFVVDNSERALADQVKSQAQSDLGMKIVTPVLPLGAFYPADASHQDYYKGTKLVLTRFGPRKQSVAYTLYRRACGRDARVLQLWGDAAPFAGS